MPVWKIKFFGHTIQDKMQEMNRIILQWLSMCPVHILSKIFFDAAETSSCLKNNIYNNN